MNTLCRLLPFLSILYASTSFALSDTQPEQNWATYIGGPGDDRIVAVREAANGDILIGGNTTSSTLVGVTPTLLGSDDPARLSHLGGFIARLSPDGQDILWLRRFGRGVFYLTDIAENECGIFVTGVATALAQDALVEPFDGYDKNAPTSLKSEYTGTLSTHESPNTYRSILLQLSEDGVGVVNGTWMGEPTPGRESYGVGDLIGDWYVSSDIWRYMKQREEWFFAGMNPYTINRIEVLENGDLILLMDGGLRWAGGQDTLYRFSGCDLSVSGLKWKTVFDAAGNNSTLETPEHASVLSADMAVGSGEDFVYVTGGSNGFTGFEPYWNPFLFKFDIESGQQLWERSDVTRGGPYGAFNIIQTMVRPYQADSYGQAVAVNADGEPLLSMWADGGNTYTTLDPWGLETDAERQDGDGFWGFTGRTFAAVLGRYNPDGELGWLRSHRIKPNPNTQPDKNATMFLDIAPAHETVDTIYAVGWTFGMAEVSPWNLSTGKGTLVKVKLGDSGSQRLLVDRFSGVEEFLSITPLKTRNRYVVGGYATAGAAVLSAVQSSHAGGKDGYLMSFAEPVQAGSSDVLDLVVNRSPDRLTLTFTAGVAGTFQLQRSASLGTEANWASLEGMEVSDASKGQVIRFKVETDPLDGFFRIIRK